MTELNNIRKRTEGYTPGPLELVSFNLETDDLSTGKTMTLREIREVLDVPRKTLEDAVNRLFPDLMQNGKTTYLDEQQVAQVSSELKRAHNVDLASTRQVAMTKLEKQSVIAQAWQFIMEEKAELEAQLADARPKVAFYDAVTGSEATIDISEVAKVLDAGIGRNRLFQFLRDNKVLRPNNQPYQRYVDAGYFRLIESKFQYPDGSTGINLKTVVYQSGLDYIRRLVEERGIS